MLLDDLLGLGTTPPNLSSNQNTIIDQMNGISGLDFGVQKQTNSGFGFGGDVAEGNETTGSGWADVDLFNQSQQSSTQLPIDFAKPPLTEVLNQNQKG